MSTVDEWLRQWLPVIMDGPDYRAGDLAVVVTFDEDDRTADNLVLTTVIAPTVSQVVAGAPLTHYSLSRYLAELGGASPLGEAATAASLRDGVRPVTGPTGALLRHGPRDWGRWPTAEAPRCRRVR